MDKILLLVLKQVVDILVTLGFSVDKLLRYHTVAGYSLTRGFQAEISPTLNIFTDHVIWNILFYTCTTNFIARIVISLHFKAKREVKVFTEIYSSLLDGKHVHLFFHN